MKRTMMIISTIYILTLLPNLFSVTWEIRQDGTGDFTTISEGITAAQDGDTLLVYPSIYYENLNYQGKNITITSLYDGDQYDDSYIANTVIDGSHEGTVVVFTNNETRNAVLNGFTIRHGRGEQHTTHQALYGGGIYLANASPVISNCIIEHNYAFSGSAIAIRTAGNLLLKGNTIRYNHSLLYGALHISSGTQIEFCSESLNNIYLNHGTMGNDLTIIGIEQTSVVVDTFTVLEPDKHFVMYHNQNIPDFNLSINHSKIEPVAADLYVSPDGCDSNSGLSPAEPLQTIWMAMIKVQPDSLQQRTIHVAEGIYSKSLNNQLFPVSLRSHTALVGADRATTILDGENSYSLIHAISHPDGWGVPIRNFAVKNFTVINGGNLHRSFESTPVRLFYVMDSILENIDVTECHTYGMSMVGSTSVGDSIVRNLHVYNNSGSSGVGFSQIENEFELYAENIRVRNIVPDFLPQGGWGRGMTIAPVASYPIMEESRITIVNLEVTGNHISNVPGQWVGLPRGNLEIFGRSAYRIVNATIGNNTSTNLTGGGFTFGNQLLHAELINSIVYGNSPNNIAVQNDTGIDQANAYISHSLIQGGEDGIHYFGNPNTVVHWGEGNIDADPLWLRDIDPDIDHIFPYQLYHDSPARNAGTLDIPDFVFPEFDLAGNPRISGSSIDMGAYEYQEFGTSVDEDLLLTPHDYNLHNYPNPIVNLKGMGSGRGVGTTIKFILPQDGRAEIDIYNLKGQFVKRVFNAYAVAGEYEVLWDGRDEQGRTVATGFYVYKLSIEGETVATGRCTFIK